MLISTPHANGRKGDLFWAGLTSLVTAAAVKLGEWAVEEMRERHKERRARKAQGAVVAEGNPNDEN